MIDLIKRTPSSRKQSDDRIVTSTENKKSYKHLHFKKNDTKRVLLAEFSNITPIKQSGKFTDRLKSKIAKQVCDMKAVKRLSIIGSRRPASIKSQPRSTLAKTTEANLRKKIFEIETISKRKDSEIATLKARINSLQNQQREKDNYIRDLELRLPQVLNNISRGIGSKDVISRQQGKETRDTLQKNKQLTGKVKELEKSNKEKEMKLRKLEMTNQKQAQELTKKESENKVLKSKLKTYPKLEARANQMEQTVKKLEQARGVLQDRLTIAETRLMEQDKVVFSLRKENDYFFSELTRQYDEMVAAENEMNEMVKCIETIKAQLSDQYCNLCSQNRNNLKDSFEDKCSRPVFSPWKMADEESPLNFTFPLRKCDLDEHNDAEGLPLTRMYLQMDDVNDEEFDNMFDQTEISHGIFDHNWSIDEAYEAQANLSNDSNDSFWMLNASEESEYYHRMENLDDNLDVMLERLSVLEETKSANVRCNQDCGSSILKAYLQKNTTYKV